MYRIVVALFAALVVAFAAYAQEYPARPVTMIVAYPPGGSTDLLARVVARRLAAHLGKEVIVENRPGAATNIGTLSVLNAPADGYTIYFAANPLIVQGTRPDAKFNILRDLQPVGLIAEDTLVFAASSKLPVKTLSELITYAKAHPGELRYATSGIGSFTHLAFELLSSKAGIKMEHIPYSGGNPSLMSVVQGETDLTMVQPAAARQHVQAGTMGMLGVSTAERWPTALDLPGMKEAGVEGYDLSIWNGIFVRKGVPEPIFARLKAGVAALSDDTELKAEYKRQNLVTSHKDFQKVIEDSVRDWSAVYRDSKIQLE
jgi:tripartite-type tricarboxylate transporter receptor subunit TctC